MKHEIRISIIIAIAGFIERFWPRGGDIHALNKRQRLGRYWTTKMDITVRTHTSFPSNNAKGMKKSEYTSVWRQAVRAAQITGISERISSVTEKGERKREKERKRGR